MKVLQYPLTQITLVFVFGILMNRYLKVDFNSGLYFLILSFSLFLIAFSIGFRTKSLVFLKIFTGTCFVLSLAIGNFTALIHQESQSEKHYIHSEYLLENAVNMKILILERWKPTKKNERFLAEITALNNKQTEGKILVNFSKAKTSKKITVGMKLALHGKIRTLQKPLNPDQFDYSSFLKNKSVFAQIYVDDSTSETFSTLKKDAYYYSAIFRNRVITNLKNSGFNDKELAVVSALILGQRQDLSPSVLQKYQFAGAIHILSVSGLHVGLVLLFLRFFLNFLPNTNRFLVFKMIMTVLILWSFALVAGFSPSVVRSVTMFSFVAIGMYMKRKTYVFYTFYCSIFLILLFEPSFLFDVGFQLSYMALFFILWLQPEFEKLWQPKSKIVHYFWQVLTITFAAQLGTMPLSLYYFHQFPGLFFVTNLLIMLLLTLIMGVGLFFVLIAFWTEMPTAIAKILEKLIWLLNYIIEKIASLEYFIFKDISFNFWMMLSLYSLILALIWFWMNRNFKRLSFVLVSVLLVQISFFAFDFNSNTKQEWLVFQSKNGSLILERDGKALTVFGDTNTVKNIRDNRVVQSYNVANGTQINQVKILSDFMFFNHKKILILNGSSEFLTHLKPDVLIVTQSPKLNFERILKEYHPKMVVVDASNYKNIIAQIQKTCMQQKIPFHDIAEKGFYKIEK